MFFCTAGRKPSYPRFLDMGLATTRVVPGSLVIPVRECDDLIGVIAKLLAQQDRQSYCPV